MIDDGRRRRAARSALGACALSLLNVGWAQSEGPAPAEPAPSGEQAPEPAGEPVPEAPKVTLPDPDAARAARLPSPGDEVIVVLTDGQRLTGRYVSGTAQAVVVTVAGVDLTIQRIDFERITVQRPLRERHREIRAMIDEGDVPRLLLLAEWLRANDLLEEAAAELAHIEKVEPTNVEASRLRRLVENQLALRAASGRAQEGAGAGQERPRPAREPAEDDGDDGSDGGTRAEKPPAFPLLTPEQVNLVKVYEIDLGGSTRIIIERPTIEKLLRDYADSPHIPTTREGREKFMALSAADILNVMFRVQARELYGEVKALGNPPAIRLFRDNVNRAWLVNSCASPGCHGWGTGRAAPTSGLVLSNRRTSNEQSFYSNLVILDRYRLADGTALIDYEKPERSPLLQMGLQRSESARPHPEVQGWAAVFRTMEDRRFVQAVEWIRGMYRPRPEYPFEYPPWQGQPGKTYEAVPR